ncbi:MAG: pyridoxal phosphate-dependent aminotransferase [Dehalococcoidales bacterium]|nr:pyridoxal phosphate-dependent aminotransferase [Dehalococcoidales bacterium]
MPVSNRIKASMAQGSWIRRMFDEGTVLKKKYGDDKVFDLSLGNPITEPPEEFRRELKKLADSSVTGMHRYMGNAGYPETRTAVARQLASDTGVNFTMDDIVMTCGASGALNVVLKTILDPGDEVILFAPYFPEYLGYIDNHNVVARVLPTDERCLPGLDSLKSALGPRTRAVLINSPNNPSGVVYDNELLHNIGDLLAKRSGTPILLISDEPYRKLVYDGRECPYIWQHYRHSIVVTSYSKDLALPGERIGYIAIRPDCDQKKEMMDGFAHCNRILGFVNAPALMQHLVRNLQATAVSLADYQRKRDFLYTNLTGMGYEMTKPEGAFYMFPKSPVKDDIAFIMELQRHLVLAVPGISFGSPGYFRIAYCVDDRTLAGCLEGFRKTIKKLKK